MIAPFRFILVALGITVLVLHLVALYGIQLVEHTSSAGEGLTSFRKWLLGLVPIYVEIEMKGVVLYDNKSISDLLISQGGQPLRTLILGSWRTGSSFLGNILQSHPGTLYIYEPDMFIGENPFSVITGPEANHQMSLMLEALYNCRWDALDPDLATRFMKGHNYFSPSLRNFSLENPEVCEDMDFLSRVCENFPVQVIKTTRYRLDTLQRLLANPSLNLKVLHLVRDPRATLNSRLQLDWCKYEPDCGNATVYCRMLEHEYHLAQEFVQKYPRTFRIVKYEELASDAFSTTEDILRFLHMSFDKTVKLFLQDNTRPGDYYDPYDTHRDSKAMPYHWMKDMASDVSIIEDIQKACSAVMNLWGYKPLSEYELQAVKALKYDNGTTSTKPQIMDLR